MARRIFVLAATLAGCKDQRTKAHDTAVDPSSNYAQLRGGLVKAISAFPEAPATLPRCDPSLTDVAVLRLDSAADVLKVKLAKAPPLLGTSLQDSTTNTFHMEKLENPAHAGPDAITFATRWYEQVQRIALLRATAVKPPVLSDCGPATAGRQECGLTPGTFDGDLVAFDKTGQPTCALRLTVEGPTFVSSRTGGVANEMDKFVVDDVADHLFHLSKSPSAGRTTWRFVEEPAAHGPAGYRVTIDQTVVLEAH